MTVSIKRKVVAQALRYVAHVNGATLETFRVKEKHQMRSSLNHLLFRLDSQSVKETDSSRALVLPAGSDSLEDIGVPRGVRKEDFEASDSKLELWMRAVAEYFPYSKHGACLHGKVSTAVLEFDNQQVEESTAFPEASVDSLRAQKRYDSDPNRDEM